MKKNDVKHDAARRPKPPARFDDNPEWTREDFRPARPASELIPAIVTAKRTPGRPKIAYPKIAVTLRLDPRIVDVFRATGRGWQSRINQALERAAKRLASQQG